MKIREYIKVGKIGDIIYCCIIYANFIVEERNRYRVSKITDYGIEVRPKWNNDTYNLMYPIFWNNLDAEITIINSKNMDIKEKFVLAITPEPKKSFRKAGVTDGDDILTDEGTKVFLTWLLHNKYAEEFKTQVVDEILKEKEEKGKE